MAQFRPRRTGRFASMGFDLHYRNLAWVGPRDVVMPNVAGAGSSLVGNLLLELGLGYVDLNRDVFLPDGSLLPPADPVSRRIRTARRPEDAARGGRGEPRFMKTHLPVEEFEGCEFGQVWLIVRDPRDAIYSWHRYHRNFGELEWEKVPEEFEEFLRRPFFLGPPPVDNWWTYYRDWLRYTDDRGIPVEVIRFEDMKSDPVGRTTGLLRAASCPLPEEEVVRACRDSSYEAMRAREEAAVGADGTAGGAGVRVMRRGQVGEWRTWMTPRLRPYFAGAELRAVAARLGYHLDEPAGEPAGEPPDGAGR
ncbi:sulfotransferase domain-containing protein [Saccharothrix syringae]|uniref:Sulfotransferase domain-containing protein n=1 Tax=Saccharothrix syringae TaxID=103733 RepID=A0A5Q0H008_SACSY|nr:sulfotransferase domain-containing protein [Saccharothrix syringae]QFZ19548.1 hypothetical protein EKG83_20805 [Saccharothrix syringae]